MRPVTIARLTSTQIVLSSGRRYRRTEAGCKPYPVGWDPISWSLRPYLLHPRDREVIDAHAALTVRDATLRIEEIIRSSGVRNASDARSLLDQLETVIALTRGKINRDTGGGE
jgi:hypothetical protein